MQNLELSSQAVEDVANAQVSVKTPVERDGAGSEGERIGTSKNKCVVFVPNFRVIGIHCRQSGAKICLKSPTV